VDESLRQVLGGSSGIVALRLFGGADRAAGNEKHAPVTRRATERPCRTRLEPTTTRIDSSTYV
jgi:hypothetical protein